MWPVAPRLRKLPREVSMMTSTSGGSGTDGVQVASCRPNRRGDFQAETNLSFFAGMLAMFL